MPIMKQGSVVTVIGNDSLYRDSQGILKTDVMDLSQEVEVEFGIEYNDEFLFMRRDGKGGTTIKFLASDLRVSQDFTPENRADRLFGKFGWHSISSFNAPFDPNAGRDCQREGCDAKASGRSMVNLNGWVVEYETCADCHKEWHGARADSFPTKKVA